MAMYGLVQILFPYLHYAIMVWKPNLTGNFRWKFTAKTLELASKLLAKGADPIEVLERMFVQKSKMYVELLEYVLNNFEYDDDLNSLFLFLPSEKQNADGIDRYSSDHSNI